MKNVQTIPWKRISVESIAIVASILLAFGIDAWWDERLEQSQEQLLLTRLGTEFSTNLERIDRLQGFAVVEDAALELYGLIDEALRNGEDTVQVPTGMLRVVLIAPVFEAEIPLLDAFTKAGKLDLVNDPQIVATVSVWERQLRDYTSMAERARRDVDTHLLPALYKRADIGALLVGPFITDLNSADPMWRVPVVMNIDIEIKGLVAGRYARASDSLRDFESLRRAAAEVIKAIDANSANP